MTGENAPRLPQLYRLAHSLLLCKSKQEALQTSIESISRLLQASNAILWEFSADRGVLKPLITVFEDKSIKTRNVSPGADFLGESYRTGKPTIVKGEALQSTNKHLQFASNGNVNSILVFPLRAKGETDTVFEFINHSLKDQTFSAEDLDFVGQCAELFVIAIRNWKTREGQTQSQLHAITRLTLLYDISQIFHSTLEMNELLPIITEKIREIHEAETCTIWIPDGENLKHFHSSGGYADLFASLKPLEDDPATDVLRGGEGILLEDASQEERLLKRFENSEETPVVSYMAAALRRKDDVLGVLEVMNRVEGEPYFTEEDQFLLNDLSAQAAVSIHNANLLATERKAKELDALLKVSHEITSTLDLNRVLFAIVNQSAQLVPYDRASITLLDRGKVDIGAVSGRMEVDKKSQEMKELQNILTWTAGLKKGLYISELNGDIATEREEDREKFKTYFEKSGFKSFVALPLKDEEGELGILCYESATPYFLDERHLEVITILANQATVAIRNAQLYRQVPLVDLMKPIIQKKAQIMKMPQSRKISWASGIVIALLLLIFVPWNMKVVGDVTMLPEFRTPVVSEVEGIVKQVHFRESDRINKGSTIAALMDNDYLLALEGYRAKRDVLSKEISRSESQGDSTTARLKRIEMDQVNREIDFSNHQLARTKLLSPVDGVIITPRIEEKIGHLVRKGEEFCEVADIRKVKAQVAVDESEISYLKNGQKISLKMNSYPTTKFYGTVTHLGAELRGNDPHKYYVVEAEIENQQELLKSGMVGKAKIATGYRSIGYVLFHTPARFIWKKLWVWLP
ncbi:GAF domain-containing protein [bacterium]|nr:GAF domain-containing protein [bacterium]